MRRILGKSNERKFYEKWFMLPVQIRWKKVNEAKEIFLDHFLTEFMKDPVLNREIIKRFADHPTVSNFSCVTKY